MQEIKAKKGQSSDTPLFVTIITFLFVIIGIPTLIIITENKLDESLLNNNCKELGYNELTDYNNPFGERYYNIECDGVVLPHECVKYDRCVENNKWGQCKDFEDYFWCINWEERK